MTEDEIVASAAVPGWPSVYVIGSFDSRITFFSQQVRGFNLAYALRESGKLADNSRIAVIGGGAAGLSVASALALLTSDTTIDVFERDKFPLHLQRRCSQRNLHPHIYDWPKKNAQESSAGLPYLNWSTASASVVAEEVILQFHTLCAGLPGRVNLKTLHDVLEISRCDATSYFLEYRKSGESKTATQSYHAIFLAIGFGAEIKLEGAASHSYWSDRGTPDAPRYAADDTIFLISGSGDGALIDLCAAAIQDFDHEHLIDLLVHCPGIDTLEPVLTAIDREAYVHGPGFDFVSAYDEHIKVQLAKLGVVDRIGELIRHRSKIIINTRRPKFLEQPTATLNRLLVYALLLAAESVGRPIQHRTGTLSVSSKKVPYYEIDGKEVIADELIVRHGAGKLKAFEPFNDIRVAYETGHKAWLSNGIERSTPPSLNAQAFHTIREAVIEKGIPVPPRPVSQAEHISIHRSLAQEYVSNITSLREAFSDRKKAALLLRQPLCPGDIHLDARPRNRSALVDQLNASLDHLENDRFIAVIGAEGCGKSWLVGQAWLSLAQPPFTLFITPEDLATGGSSPLDLLSKKLAEIPASKNLRHDIATWNERLASWQLDGNGPTQGLVVVLDGINQRPREDWAYIIASLCQELSKFGGKLVITARAHYFRTHVFPGLISECTEINVPEWTPAERDDILSSAGVDPNQLHEDVAQTLCNPRLLGIALTLLSNKELKTLNELSVSRLLFEHVHNSQRDGYGSSPFEFKRGLVDRAKEIFKRLTSQQQDDLNVFDGGLQAVIDGRFFQPLPGDPTRYTINPSGLGLALGLAIVDDLRAGVRNHRNLNDRLLVLTEPIAALDQTFEAMLAALTIACVDTETPNEIVTAILVAFSRLQNPEESLFHSFAALTRIRPRAYLLATEELTQLNSRVSNFDWIELSLLQVRREHNARAEIEAFIKRWLNSVTLDINHRIYTAGLSDEQIAEKREQYTAELDEKLCQLNSAEQILLQSMSRMPNHAIDELSRIAFNLLASLSLKGFAGDFVRWSFAANLNGSHHRPTEMFMQLVCYNPVDWSETREKLLIATEHLLGSAPSNTGRWATVTIRRSTGDPDDAGEAKKHVDELVGDREKFVGWRLIERYCAVDPCDPTSSEPANVTKTIEKYATVDVTRLCLTMGQGEDDLFFRQARAAASRFAPDVAIERHRALIDDVSHRSGAPLRQGIVYLLENSALVTPLQASRLADQLGSAEPGKAALRSLGDEETMWRMFHLEIIFPALDACRQLELLIEGDYQGSLSQRVIHMIKPLDAEAFKEKLLGALESQNLTEQHLVLLFSPFRDTSVTFTILNRLTDLLHSSSALVRAYTMRLAQMSGDPVAIKAVFENLPRYNSCSEWTSRLERWHASLLIIDALRLNYVDLPTVASRIEYVHLGRLASKLGGDAAIYASGVVNSLIQLGLGLEDSGGNLQITVRQAADTADEPQYIGLCLRDRNDQTRDTTLDQFLKDEEDFDHVQQTLHLAYERVKKSLTHQNASHLLEQFSLDDFTGIVKASPALFRQWCVQLLQVEKIGRLSAVRNIGLLLARELAVSSPDNALELFKKLEPVRPLVQINYGNEGIELAQMVVWSAARCSVLDTYRAGRLDRATNNEELAKEVFAALWGLNDDLLIDYIENRLTSSLPVLKARAIYVAGLMPQNPVSDRILSTYAGVPGLIGETQAAANKVYKKAAWATHWLSQMRRAESPEDFWRASVLFLEVTDGREETLRPVKETSIIYRQHWASVQRQFDNRFKQIRDKRKKKLFDNNAPLRQFLGLDE
jgi:hypothetical protein